MAAVVPSNLALGFRGCAIGLDGAGACVTDLAAAVGFVVCFPGEAALAVDLATEFCGLLVFAPGLEKRPASTVALSDSERFAVGCPATGALGAARSEAVDFGTGFSVATAFVPG